MKINQEPVSREVHRYLLFRSFQRALVMCVQEYKIKDGGYFHYSLPSRSQMVLLDLCMYQNHGSRISDVPVEESFPGDVPGNISRTLKNISFWKIWSIAGYNLPENGSILEKRF